MRGFQMKSNEILLEGAAHKMLDIFLKSKECASSTVGCNEAHVIVQKV